MLKHTFRFLHVIVTPYPFPWGCGVLLLEPIPALSQGEGRVLPGQGVQYLAQGHFDMQLRSLDLNQRPSDQ